MASCREAQPQHGTGGTPRRCTSPLDLVNRPSLNRRPPNRIRSSSTSPYYILRLTSPLNMLATVSARPRGVASGSRAARAHAAAPLAVRPMQHRVAAVQQRVMATAMVVQGRNVEVTPALKAAVEEKIGKAIKMFAGEGVKEVGAGASSRTSISETDRGVAGPLCVSTVTW